MDFENYLNKGMHDILKIFTFWFKNFDITFYAFLFGFGFLSSTILFPSKTWKPGLKKYLSDFHIIQSLVHLCDHLTITFSYFKQTQSPALHFIVFLSEYFFNIYIFFYSTLTQYKTNQSKVTMWHMCFAILSRGWR